MTGPQFGGYSDEVVQLCWSSYLRCRQRRLESSSYTEVSRSYYILLQVEDYLELFMLRTSLALLAVLAAQCTSLQISRTSYSSAPTHAQHRWSVQEQLCSQEWLERRSPCGEMHTPWGTIVMHIMHKGPPKSRSATSCISQSQPWSPRPILKLVPGASCAY